MMRGRATTRTRRIGAGLAIAVVATGLSLSAARPAAAAAVPVVGGSIDWGVKASFRSYVTGPVASGTITTGAGASVNGDGSFRFAVVDGTFDGATATQAGSAGSVAFLGHGGSLDVAISDIGVSIGASSAFLVADVASRQFTGGAPGPLDHYDDIQLGALDLTGIVPVVGAGTATWTDVPVSLTAQGAPAFAGFYPSGEALDTVDITLALSDLPQWSRPLTAGSITWPVSEQIWTQASLNQCRATTGAATITEGTWNVPPTGIVFPSSYGSYDPTTGATAIDGDGSVMLGNRAQGNYRIRIAEPTLVIDADGAGRMLADVSWSLANDPAPTTPYPTATCSPELRSWSTPARVPVVTFQADPANRTVVGNAVSWTVTPPWDTASYSFAPEFVSALHSTLQGHFWATPRPPSPTDVLTASNLRKPPAPIRLAFDLASTPGAPATVTATPGNGSVSLSWTAPTDDGGRPITGYVVGGGGTCVPATPTATSCTVNGLVNGAAVSFTVAAVNVVGTGPVTTSDAVTPRAPAAPIVDHTAVPTKRLFDTRPGESPDALRAVAKQPIGGSRTLEVKVVDLAGVVPASGVGAVSINVTATNATADGFVTVDACGPRALVSSLNYAPNAARANAVIAAVSATGTICFSALTDVDLVVDVNGWFAVGGAYTAVAPNRVFDTRAGESPSALRSVAKQRIGGDARILEVQLTDLGAVVPASGVSSVSLNVTAVAPDAVGFVTVYTCGVRELVSSLNFSPGKNVANAVIAPVSATGTVCFYASQETDLVVDVNGWLSSPSDYTAISPKRVFDTRPGESPAALRDVAERRVGGEANILEVRFTDLAGAVPAAGVGSVSLNVTVTNAAATGFLTVYSCGTRELVSTLNFSAGETVANAVLTGLSPTGTLCFYASQDTDVIADVNGWFATT